MSGTKIEPPVDPAINAMAAVAGDPPVMHGAQLGSLTLDAAQELQEPLVRHTRPPDEPSDESVHPRRKRRCLLALPHSFFDVAVPDDLVRYGVVDVLIPVKADVEVGRIADQQVVHLPRALRPEALDESFYIPAVLPNYPQHLAVVAHAIAMIMVWNHVVKDLVRRLDVTSPGDALKFLQTPRRIRYVLKDITKSNTRLRNGIRSTSPQTSTFPFARAAPEFVSRPLGSYSSNTFA